MKALAITSALILGIAAPAFADITRTDAFRANDRPLKNWSVIQSEPRGITAGHRMLAANLGLDPNKFSLAQLAAIKGAYDEDDPRN